jgi:proteasome activator subunit 3 (PA28 gamma)
MEKLSISNSSEDWSEHKARLIAEGKRLAKDVLPSKVIELDKIYNEIKDLQMSQDAIESLQSHIERELQSSVTNNAKHNSESGDSGSTLQPTVIRENSMAPNKVMVEIVGRLRPHIDTLNDNASKVRMWITLQIPKIEDGNNFGVSIQEAVIDEAYKLENIARSYRESGGDYFFYRARMISKIIKYPEIADYKMAVYEYDSNELKNQINLCRDLRDFYAKLYDLVIKNLQKIENPRPGNIDSLY